MRITPLISLHHKHCSSSRSSLYWNCYHTYYRLSVGLSITMATHNPLSLQLWLLWEPSLLLDEKQTKNWTILCFNYYLFDINYLFVELLYKCNITQSYCCTEHQNHSDYSWLPVVSYLQPNHSWSDVKYYSLVESMNPNPNLIFTLNSRTTEVMWLPRETRTEQCTDY